MKVLVILLALVAAACASPPNQSFDSLNVNQYRDRTKLRNLVRCVSGAGPCGNQLEVNVRDRLKKIVLTDCGDCNLRERDSIVILTNFIADANKDDIAKLLRLVDPSGQRSQHYLKFLNRVSEQRGLPKLSNDIINAFPYGS